MFVVLVLSALVPDQGALHIVDGWQWAEAETCLGMIEDEGITMYL